MHPADFVEQQFFKFWFANFGEARLKTFEGLIELAVGFAMFPHAEQGFRRQRAVGELAGQRLKSLGGFVVLL